MSVIEEISKLSKDGRNDALLDYIYMRITMRLNVNLMERIIRNPKSAIVIFVWTVT